MINQTYPTGETAFAPSVFDRAELTRRVSSVMRRVYLKMTLALVVTALASLFTINVDSLLYFTVDHFMVMFFIQLGLVIALTAALHKLSTVQATALFYLYAITTGVVLAPICLVYTGVSIAKTFLITATTFGAMSVYGYFTTRDLTSWGRILLFALIGLIVCSLINLLTKSAAFEWLISAVGVLVFIGLTAWDTQKIKSWAEQSPGETTGKLATIGALSLYLDFVNLFLYLLRFMGNRR